MTYIIKLFTTQELKHLASFYDTLRFLSKAPDLSIQKSSAILSTITAQGTTIFIAKDTQTQNIVGTSSILIEQKFIRGGGKVAHIEDTVIHKDHQGQGLGSQLLNHAISYAKNQGVYKIILDCDTKLIERYKGFGFVEKGGYMAMYID